MYFSPEDPSLDDPTLDDQIWLTWNLLMASVLPAKRQTKVLSLAVVCKITWRSDLGKLEYFLTYFTESGHIHARRILAMFDLKSHMRGTMGMQFKIHRAELLQLISQYARDL